MRSKLVIMICLMIIPTILTITPKISKVYAQASYLKLVSDVTELGPENVEGQNFTVRCLIEDVTDLYGLDIQIMWTTEYIEYVSHTKKIPVETYPDGVLHSPTVPVKDDVDENASMPGSAPNTMYWVSEASMLPAAPFDGNGTVFEMTFRVKKHPTATDSHIYVNFTSSTLSDSAGNPIDHTAVNLHILLHGQLQPAGPEIRISSTNYKGLVPYNFDVNVSILNLDPYWDLGGFDIKIGYSPEVLEAISVVIDPDGWFESFWDDMLVVVNSTDNDIGRVCLAVLGIPFANGTHIEPQGNATLCKITFKAYASGPIEKIEDSLSLAAYPHPERPEPPFNNHDWSVPIPFNVTNGFAHVVGVKEHEPLTGYTLITESNSSVSSMFFEPGVPLLMFNVTGVDGYLGYCNVTIPKSFMWSNVEDGWIVLVDGQMVTPIITEDTENTYVYFTYMHSVHSISIMSTSVIPEFPLPTFLIVMIAAALVIGLMKKKIK